MLSSSRPLCVCPKIGQVAELTKVLTVEIPISCGTFPSDGTSNFELPRDSEFPTFESKRLEFQCDGTATARLQPPNNHEPVLSQLQSKQVQNSISLGVKSAGSGQSFLGWHILMQYTQKICFFKMAGVRCKFQAAWTWCLPQNGYSSKHLLPDRIAENSLTIFAKRQGCAQILQKSSPLLVLAILYMYKSSLSEL